MASNHKKQKEFTVNETFIKIKNQGVVKQNVTKENVYFQLSYIIAISK